MPGAIFIAGVASQSAEEQPYRKDYPKDQFIAQENRKKLPNNYTLYNYS